MAWTKVKSQNRSEVSEINGGKKVEERFYQITELDFYLRFHLSYPPDATAGKQKISLLPFIVKKARNCRS
ncbi:hypothetical protein SDC9_140351 [bioreactor metagenome]|uniref:Uncharacterized protein n=1 Tax=bioreactor metagenome TaxID=1076179 RepID=A0A645DVA0_9ZZZZ